MQAIDEILEVLKNGEWHELKEVSSKTRMQELKVELITNFLAEYDFLKVNLKKRKVKLSPQMLQFLERIEDVEREHNVDQKKGLVRHSFSVNVSHSSDVSFSA